MFVVQYYLLIFILQEDRCAEAEQNIAHMVHVQEETELLQGALRDIAYALIQDAESKDMDLSHGSHLHLSSTPVPQK